MLADDRYTFIVSHIEGMALDALWLYAKEESNTFQGRKRAFLWVLEKMLNEGLILVAKRGELLNISPKEIIAQFENALPEDEANLDDGIWFFTEACPAGIGWRTANGEVDWV
jgi:hypothetical protein